MKVKILNGVLALLMFVGLTFFAASCGEEANSNNNNNNQTPVNQKYVTSADVDVLDNSFEIIDNTTIELTYKEDTTLNLDKSNFNVTLHYSDGSIVENFTNYQIQSDVPSPIVEGYFNVTISSDEVFSNSYTVNIKPKTISGFEAIQQANLQTHYTGEEINVVDMVNANYNNLLESNKNFYTINQEGSTINASAVGSYTLVLNAKANYTFEGNADSIVLPWSIQKREIVAFLDSKQFEYKASVQNISEEIDNPEYAIVVENVVPKISFAFADDLETILTGTFTGELLKISLNENLPSGSVGIHQFYVTFNGSFGDCYKFVDNDYGMAVTLDEAETLIVSYEVTPLVINKPTITNGDAYHYTFNSNPVYIEPLYNGKTLSEYENDNEQPPIESFIFDYLINNNYDAINASPNAYQATFKLKDNIDSANFKFKNDEENSIYNVEYSFFIDKKQFSNDLSLTDNITVADILNTEDNTNYIGANVVLEASYQDNLSINMIDAKHSGNMLYNSVYTASTKTYFNAHGLMTEDSFIDFDANTLENFANTTLVAGTYDITLIYVHSYRTENLTSEYNADFANFTSLTFPAKLVIKPYIVDINLIWTISYGGNNYELTSNTLELTYDGDSHTADVAFYGENEFYQYMTIQTPSYYCSKDNNPSVGVSAIQDVGRYYVRTKIISTNPNYTPKTNAQDDCMHSPYIYINKKEFYSAISFDDCAALSGVQNGVSFSYHTGKNKPVDYTIGLAFNPYFDNSVLVTKDNLNSSSQNIIASLDDISAVYEYSADGTDYSELVGENIDLSQIGYYKLTVSYTYNTANYTLVGSEPTEVREWRIIGTTFDVSGVQWVNTEDFEYNGTLNYEDDLLKNVPFGIFPQINYAGQNDDGTTINIYSSTGHANIGANYAYITSFTSYDYIDGAYENDTCRLTITGADNVIGKAANAEDLYYDESTGKYTLLNGAHGKIFYVTKKIFEEQGFVWGANYDYVNAITNPAEYTVTNESETLSFSIQYQDSVYDSSLTKSYSIEKDGKDSIELGDTLPTIDLSEVADYTITVTLTIPENLKDKFIFDNDNDDHYTLELTLIVSVLEN